MKSLPPAAASRSRMRTDTAGCVRLRRRRRGAEAAEPHHPVQGFQLGEAELHKDIL